MTNVPAAATTLDEIVAFGFVADEPKRELICRGANHRDNGQLGTCGRCGGEVVKRLGGKGGYCDPTSDEWGNLKFWCWGRHECDPDRAAVRRDAVLRDLACGELHPRFPVVVTKGRKVPIGTVGVLTWIGEGGYGGLRVGLRDTAGATHWTAASNVEVHVEGELAELVCAVAATLI